MESYLIGLFSQPPGTPLGFEDFLVRLLVALLVGQAVAWAYGASHGALSYSQNFVQSLVLLSMVVCVIMCVVGDSLARAFGLGAALAIVRFRTPIKDARDTAFLFLSVAVGMAAGAGQNGIALGGSLLIGAAALYLSWSAFGARGRAEGLLRFRFSGDAQRREAMASILGKHCSSFHLSGVRAMGEGDGEELLYDVSLRSEESGPRLVGELTDSGVARAITLLPHAHVQEG